MTDHNAETTARAVRLYNVYARAVDEGDLDTLRKIATDDIRMTRAAAPPIEGMEPFLDVYRAQNASVTEVCKHVVTNVTADRLDDGTIQTHAYFQATMFDPTETRIIVGYYDDVHVEDGEEHRLAHKKIAVERFLTLPKAASGYVPVGTSE
ncbi:nuclear transport factor 2 family protein [Streptosporangium sp. NPDC002607]